MFFSHKEQKGRRVVIFAAKSAKKGGVFRIGALPRAPETLCVSVTLCEISHGEEKTSVRGSENLRVGESKPPLGDFKTPVGGSENLRAGRTS